MGFVGGVTPNNSMQRTALRAAADAERYPEKAASLPTKPC
jgi:hypothetical protein